MARSRTGLSIRYWFFNVVTPVFFATAVAAIMGCLPILCARPSFVRLLLTTACSESALLLLSWLFVLNDSERLFVREHLRASLRRIRGVYG